MSEVQLKVKLLGHTQLSQEFVEEIKEEILGEAYDKEITDGQLIAFTAIRNCYSHLEPLDIVNEEFDKYFGNIASDGKGGTDADRLMRHITSSGHCYDDQTEVLTKRGYILFRDLVESDEVAMVDESGTFAGFTKNWKYVEYKPSEHEGFIYRYDNRDISFGVTSKHRMFISPSRKLKKWEIKEMKDIQYKEYRVMSVPNGRTTEKSTKYSSEQLKLIGFFIGDGYGESDHVVTFHIKKERKILYLDSLLKECNGINKYSKYENKDGTYKYVVDVSFFNPLEFYSHDKKKTLNGLQLLESSEFIALFDGLMNSDGSHTVSNGVDHYCTESKCLENELSVLLSINGIAHKNDGYGRISIKKDRSKYPFVCDSRKEFDNPSKAEYSGNTYCVQVPTGVLVVRRDGKTMVCGNTSTLEHVSFTFAVQNISRALLAQLTRHRVGFSFSVKSQRYVKFGSENKSGGANHIVPDKIKNNPDALIVFSEFQQHSQEIYDNLRALGIPAEDARSVLTNATSTSLVMSANISSLLWFYMRRRKGNGAQSEIAELAEVIRQKVVSVEPWLDQFFENA